VECGGPKAKRGKEAKTMNKVIENRWHPTPQHSDSSSGFFPTVGQAAICQRFHFWSSHLRSAWPNLKSKWALRKPSRCELTVENYQLHALEQPITTQQYSNSPYWACHVPRWNWWGTFHTVHKKDWITRKSCQPNVKLLHQP
jgi:hypothetical protein